MQIICIDVIVLKMIDNDLTNLYNNHISDKMFYGGVFRGRKDNIPGCDKQTSTLL